MLKISIFFIFLVFLAISAYSEQIPNFEKLADAIKKAENSTKYPYGIVSINVHGNEELARKICLNTIRANYKRFKNQTKYKDYLEFLATRYAPVNCSNDNGTNRFWLRNV